MNTSEQLVIIRLQDRLFGLPADAVREIVTIPHVVKVPMTPSHFRGIINLRGQIMPLIDLRARLGLPSLLSEKGEILSIMVQREQDHKNWLNELESSVSEQREFKLATDPHLCKFGKWYYSYQTTDVFFKAFLNQFESPHNRIHAIAIQAQKYVSEGQVRSALQLVEDTRKGTLQEMLRLFAQFPEEYQHAHTEIVVVLNTGAQPFAITVDSVVCMEQMELSHRSDALPALMSSQANLISCVSRLPRSEETVLLLETASLFGGSV